MTTHIETPVASPKPYRLPRKLIVIPLLAIPPCLYFATSEPVPQTAIYNDQATHNIESVLSTHYDTATPHAIAVSNTSLTSQASEWLIHADLTNHSAIPAQTIELMATIRLAHGESLTKNVLVKLDPPLTENMVFSWVTAIKKPSIEADANPSLSVEVTAWHEAIQEEWKPLVPSEAQPNVVIYNDNPMHIKPTDTVK